MLIDEIRNEEEPVASGRIMAVMMTPTIAAATSAVATVAHVDLSEIMCLMVRHKPPHLPLASHVAVRSPFSFLFPDGPNWSLSGR